MYGKPVVSNRAKPGSPKKLREVDTITLDTSKDVSDNAKLFRAMTEATGTMMEQLSKQMVEFEEMRNVADQKESIRLDRMEKEILSGQKHMEILEILNLSSNSHGKLTGKFDKTMEVLHDINGGHAKTVGQIKTQDQRLANLEKTGQETNNLLKQMKASQDNMSRALDTIMKQSDCSRVKGWLDDHTKGLHSKFEGHGKKQDDLAKRIMDGTPDHATIMKGVHGLLNDHLTAHQSKVSAAIKNLPLPPDEKVLLQAVENMQEASLGQTLEAIKKLQSSIQGKIDDQGKRVNEICSVLDDMPNHGALMKGVHGLLGEHLNDHSGRVMSEISKLPLPPNEKIMLQAIENLEGSVLGATLEAIEGVKASLGNHADSLDDLHSKMGSHERHFAGLRDGMPDHDDIMKGVHGLLGEHLGDHGGKVMKEINKLPIPADEKIMLQAIENMEESVLTRMLEAIEDVKKEVVGHADKLDGHGKAMETLVKNMDDMPDHDTLMKGVHGLLGDHLGDHSGAVMSEINKLPLPANEKVMLQAMENMEEQVLATILEAIEGVKKEVVSHAERLDGHAETMADLCKNMDSMPDHDQLMKGVHGLLGDHLGDHSGQVMSEINKLPLPANEKVMLQAMENMEEQVLATILEAIEGVKKEVAGHAEKLDGHAESMADMCKNFDSMPDHDALMKGVHGLLGDHLGDHSGQVMSEINKLPLPANEKVMLQAMENMEESVLAAMLEAVAGVKEEVLAIKDQVASHAEKLDGHAGAMETLVKNMDDMPDHDTLMKGVHGLLGDHLGDHSGAVMSEINKLPLPANEKVMLQAMENMEEQVLATILEAIEGVKKEVTSHAERLDGHADAMSDMVKNFDSMPDHDALMKGVHGLLGDHLGDHSGQVMSEINKLPLPANEKVMLQAMENMEESVLAAILEAIEGVKTQISAHADRLDSHGKGLDALLEGMPDQDALMKGVHGIVGDHLGDHSGAITSEINKLPLPADEKIMLQAMENMEESVLRATLEAIEGAKADIYQSVKAELDQHHTTLSAHSEYIMEEMGRRQNQEQVMLSEIEGMLNNAIGGMAFVSAFGVKVSESQLGGNASADPRSRSTSRAPPSSPPKALPAREAAPTPSWLKDSSKKDAAEKDTTSKWASSRTSTRSQESSPTPSWLKDKDSAKSTNLPTRAGRASEASSPAPSSSRRSGVTDRVPVKMKWTGS